MDPKELGLVTPHNKPWFYEKYFRGGANNRYTSFQIVLNMLNTVENPLIVETGCQREEDDIGAGMSTTIFAEYIHRYGGHLIVVDNVEDHLNRAKRFVNKGFPQVIENNQVDFELSDSVHFLQNYNGKPFNLVYLDSYDYPYVEMLNRLGRKHDASNQPEIEQKLWAMSEQEVHNQFKDITVPCQEHCMNEFLAAEKSLPPGSLLLIDDVSFPGGGKPGILLDYLCGQNNYAHLWTYQQSLWLKWR